MPPAVHPRPLVFNAGQALPRRGLAGWLTRQQAWLFFPLLTLEAMNLHVSSLRALMRPGARHRGLESILMVAHVAVYVALLVTALNWPARLFGIDLCGG